jgi:hypothetical protein
MLQFWELDLTDQMTVLEYATTYTSLYDLQTDGAILSHVYYDQRSPATSISSLVKRTASTDTLVNAVLLTLQQERFTKRFNLHTVWGFILQKDGKNVLVCNNILGYDSTHVVVFCLDSLIDSPHIEYHYMDKMPNRLKTLHAGIGFGLVCLLLDSAKNFKLIPTTL